MHTTQLKKRSLWATISRLRNAASMSLFVNNNNNNKK